MACVFIAIAVAAAAEDWPTYQHDSQRSAVTSEQLNPPLAELWTYASKHVPRPAWPPPAKADFWHDLPELNPRLMYDRAFHVAVVGNFLYFASSADDKVYCLDASTGEVRWSFFTGGPVRLAPTVFEGNVYVGSDDGFVYCLDGVDGSLIWKYKAAANDRIIAGNGRMISVWPVRTGVLVEDGTAYFCAGLFPNEGVSMCALDANGGSEIWTEKPRGLSPQGYLLASSTRLYVPTGRTAPVVFSRRDGKLAGRLDCPRAEGGTYALLTDDALISGPGTQLREFSTETQDQIAAYAGRHIIVTESASYLLSDNELSAIDRAKHSAVTKRRAAIAKERKELGESLSNMRKKRETLEGDPLETLDKKIDRIVMRISDINAQLKAQEGSEYKWRRECYTPYSMILAGDVLFIGGDGVVAAFRTTDGERLWTGKVAARAYGLAAANGCLFVSTDKGTIHCFGEPSIGEDLKVHSPQNTSPYPKDDLSAIYASAASYIIDKAGIQKGYCLVLGCGEGRLAYELVKRTDLKIIGVEEDAKRVQAARKALDEAGLYGVRVTVHHGPLVELPYTDYLANLVVSDQIMISGEIPTSADEIFRVLKPCDGIAYLGQTIQAAKHGQSLSPSALENWVAKASEPDWKIMKQNGLWVEMRRGQLAGSGEWTHKYADAGNSTCSADQLVGRAMQVQWFGRPGPRHIIDRHHRPMAPLSKDGRLFIYGDDRVIVADAYNGTLLWEVNIPNFRRVGAPRDAGNMVITDENLYVAVQDSCWGLDDASGERSMTLKVPQLVSDTLHQWGYIASVDDLLFGSGQKEEAAYTEVSKAGDYEIQWGDFKRMVTSDYLFCLDRHDGQRRWTYKHGVIINPTIAIGDGRMYFVESHSPEALADDDGKITLDVLLGGGANLVALDIQTGKTIWEQPVDLSMCHHIMYLSYINDTILVTGSKNREGYAWYYLYGFDAQNGELLWQQDHPNNRSGIDGDHGEQIHHPVIVGNIVYAEPRAYNLRTGVRVNPGGEEANWSTRRRGGCGTMSASSLCLFYRDSNPSVYDLRPGGGLSKLTHVNRPGCWINIIPAGGLVLIPEGSSGCTCSYPLQTSIALIPK